MKLQLKRIYTCKDYTIGHLYVNGLYNNDEHEHDHHVKWHYICDTLEDTDRGLDSAMTITQILNIKVPHNTAIPTGTYKIAMNIVSPKYSTRPYYQLICKGRVPRLLDVKGYDGILIHVGNTAADTSGCILVGFNKAKGKVLNSKAAFEQLYPILKKAYNNKEDISITISRSY